MPVRTALLLLPLILFAICAMSVGSTARAGSPGNELELELKSIDALLATPEQDVDLARAKLTIDRLIDPSIDVETTVAQLHALAQAVVARLPAGASRSDQHALLLSTLYEPGPWNDHRPFSYDLENPLGTDIQAKLLSTYLRTRKGNCVSMPILVTLLADRLGLPATLATAPEHVLTKVVDDRGQWLNIEATDGGFKYDSSYERELGISAKAIENGIYLRPLSRREAIGVMLATLMEFYNATGQHERQITVAERALSLNANDVVAMQHLGGANYKLLQERYVSHYPTPAQIPAELRADFERLSRDNLRWYAQAEALGWTVPTPEQRAAYLQQIQRQHTTQRTPR
jgi:regulator of sirC expression with transglutaminase-like and TPR domain